MKPINPEVDDKITAALAEISRLKNAIRDARERLAKLQKPALHRGPDGEICTYPKCKCPFDAPADPNWCARGLKKK